jgi:hypothetical protein
MKLRVLTEFQLAQALAVFWGPEIESRRTPSVSTSRIWVASASHSIKKSIPWTFLFVQGTHTSASFVVRHEIFRTSQSRTFFDTSMFKFIPFGF